MARLNRTHDQVEDPDRELKNRSRKPTFSSLRFDLRKVTQTLFDHVDFLREFGRKLGLTSRVITELERIARTAERADSAILYRQGRVDGTPVIFVAEYMDPDNIQLLDTLKLRPDDMSRSDWKHWPDTDDPSTKTWEAKYSDAP
jgi:hypothetical protein